MWEYPHRASPKEKTRHWGFMRGRVPLREANLDKFSSYIYNIYTEINTLKGDDKT